jgi:hypothetical protein
MWNQNLAPQVNWALAEDPGVYLGGKKYISFWNNGFLKVQIYVIHVLSLFQQTCVNQRESILIEAVMNVNLVRPCYC